MSRFVAISSKAMICPDSVKAFEIEESVDKTKYRVLFYLSSGIIKSNSMIDYEEVKKLMKRVLNVRV